jgi:hypothetical protein
MNNCIVAADVIIIKLKSFLLIKNKFINSKFKYFHWFFYKNFNGIKKY